MALVWQNTGMKKTVTNPKYTDSEILKTISIIKHYNIVWKFQIDFPLLEIFFN